MDAFFYSIPLLLSSHSCGVVFVFGACKKRVLATVLAMLQYVQYSVVDCRLLCTRDDVMSLIANTGSQRRRYGVRFLPGNPKGLGLFESHFGLALGRANVDLEPAVTHTHTHSATKQK